MKCRRCSRELPSRVFTTDPGPSSVLGFQNVMQESAPIRLGCFLARFRLPGRASRRGRHAGTCRAGYFRLPGSASAYCQLVSK